MQVRGSELHVCYHTSDLTCVRTVVKFMCLCLCFGSQILTNKILFRDWVGAFMRLELTSFATSRLYETKVVVYRPETFIEFYSITLSTSLHSPLMLV